MQTNATKAKLKAGETVYGCFVRYPDPSLVEMLGYHEWDFVVFDAEHGTIEPRDCENMVRAAELRGITPLARVTTNQAPIILRFLDTGAHGVHVPWVNSAAEAEAAVRAIKYQPQGLRGLAGVRAAGYGLRPLDAYIGQANAETLVVIQVETAAALACVEDIAAVEGVDVIFIGPNDLSHSLGVAGHPEHPRVQAAMQHIVEAVAASPAGLGIMVPNAQAAHEWHERGARYITVNLEALLSPAVQSFLHAVPRSVSKQ